MTRKDFNRILHNIKMALGRRHDRYLDSNVPHLTQYQGGKWVQFLLDKFDKPGVKVLEIGSRRVTPDNIKSLFKHASYTGFDLYPGENVDVVGDIHTLSKHVDGKFDLIFSKSVFEHLAMPWIAATEIAKLVNVGGYIYIETHYCFGSHERPWHFFQFSEEALKILFSPALGFRSEFAGVYDPIVGYFSDFACEQLARRPVYGLYCSSCLFAEKVKNVEDFSWENLDYKAMIETLYPPDSAFSNKS